MGTKRPFDEELEEFSVRRPKHLDSGDKLTSVAKILPSFDTSQKLDIGEADGIFHKIHYGDELESDNVNCASDLAESSTSGEDAGSPEYFDFNFPRRTLVQFGDLYSYLLNCPPRKEVPIGPNYQAEVPFWDPGAAKGCTLDSNYMVDGDNELKVMGTCVVPFPDFGISVHDCVSGYGRPDCDCPDEGSVRCVQQHVEEAREKLREMLGHEKFVDLGFSGMGEVVAYAWNEEEERVFHEVVYSNPISLGKKFWDHLRLMLPSRTKKELVSYYFNVFMLRRRAVQNRSNLLEIDSDDDEWQGDDGRPAGLIRGDLDSAFPNFVDQDVSLDHEDDSVHENGNSGFDQGDDSLHENRDCNLNHRDDSVDKNGVDEDNSDDDDGNYRINDVSQRDGDVGVGGKDATANDGGRGHVSNPPMGKLLVGCRVGGIVNHVDNTTGKICGELDVQDLHPADGHAIVTNVCGSAGVKADTQEIKVENDVRKCLHGNCDGSSDGLVSGYILEACDAKVWEAAYSVSSTKGVDLLSTCNMIEEIFGPSSCSNKTSNDKSIT